MEKQNWDEIKNNIREYYPDWDDIDLKIAYSFFKAGFNIYPEAGVVFQKREIYEDKSARECNIKLSEARVICSTFALEVNDDEK